MSVAAMHRRQCAEPGFARRERKSGFCMNSVKKGDHGGNLVSPVLGGGERYVRRLKMVEKMEEAMNSG